MRRRSMATAAERTSDTSADRSIEPSVPRAPPACAGGKASDRTPSGSPRGQDSDRTIAVQDFATAIREYQQTSGRMFPTWSEVLEVAQGLGYTKITGQKA